MKSYDALESQSRSSQELVSEGAGRGQLLEDVRFGIGVVVFVFALIVACALGLGALALVGGLLLSAVLHAHPGAFYPLRDALASLLLLGGFVALFGACFMSGPK